MTILRILTALMVLALVSCASTGVNDMKKAEAHYKLGVSHLNGGSIQPAFVEFQTALKFDKNNKEVHNALGTVYISLDDLQSAATEFQIATKIDPNYSEAFNNLCYVNYLMGQWDNAIASCKSALDNQLYMTPEKAYYNIGRTYYRKGDYDAAITAYGEALKRLPILHLAYYGLALAYNGKSEYGKAADAMTRAINLDPEFQGDKDKAEEKFSRGTGNLSELQDFRDYLDILKY